KQLLQPDIGKADLVALGVNAAPWPALEKYPDHTGVPCRQHVVVEAVADIGDVCRRRTGAPGDLHEEPGCRLLDTEPRGGGDEVDVEVHRGDRCFGFDRLVAGDPNSVAVRA